MVFFISLISVFIFFNSFFVILFFSCLARHNLAFLPLLFYYTHLHIIIHIITPFYLYDSFFSLSLLWETNHCFSVMFELTLFWCFLQFHIRRLYSSVLVCLIFLVNNEVLKFTFTSYYCVLFCVTGVACTFIICSSFLIFSQLFRSVFVCFELVFVLSLN